MENIFEKYELDEDDFKLIAKLIDDNMFDFPKKIYSSLSEKMMCICKYFKYDLPRLKYLLKSKYIYNLDHNVSSFIIEELLCDEDGYLRKEEEVNEILDIMIKHEYEFAQIYYNIIHGANESMYKFEDSYLVERYKDKVNYRHLILYEEQLHVEYTGRTTEKHIKEFTVGLLTKYQDKYLPAKELLQRFNNGEYNKIYNGGLCEDGLESCLG